MFEAFPFLEGRYLNYSQYYALISMLILLAFSLLFYFISRIFKYLENLQTRYFILKQAQNPLAAFQEDKNENEERFLNIQDSKSKEEIFLTGRTKNQKNERALEPVEKKLIFGSPIYRKSLRIKLLYWISYGFSIISLAILSFTPICWSAFDYLPIPAAIFLMLFLYYLRFFMDIYDFVGPRPQQGNFFTKRAREFLRINYLGFKNFMIFFIIANIFIIFFSVFLPFLFEKTCVSQLNPFIGFRFGNWDVSTRFTRLSSENEKCPSGKPCHIYATLPPDADQSVFINLHTSKIYNEVFVYYDFIDYFKINQKFRFNSLAKTFAPELEKVGERNVHSALLRNLVPNTTYAIGIHYNGKLQDIKSYKTLPATLNTTDEIVFVQGGDIGTTDASRHLTNNIIPWQPSVIFMGGDTTYDNGMVSCYHTWDNLLWMLDTLNTASNVLIPIVLAVGNHDLSVNSLASVSYREGKHTPLILQYFPQHYDNNSNPSVPSVSSRLTYFVHHFANISFFSLDSGFAATFRGEQLDFIDAEMKKFNRTKKFAQYHVPIYSPCMRDTHDKTANLEALYFWSSIFDKYGVSAAFENHDHLRKRTHPLKGNAVNPSGTIYLGNGGWGARIKKCRNGGEDFWASLGEENHLWVTKMGVNKIKHTAIGIEGKELDSVERLFQE